MNLQELNKELKKVLRENYIVEFNYEDEKVQGQAVGQVQAAEKFDQVAISYRKSTEDIDDDSEGIFNDKYEAYKQRDESTQKNEAGAKYPVYVGIAGPNSIATGSSLEFDKWLKYMQTTHPSAKVKKEIKQMTVAEYKKFTEESTQKNDP